MFKKVLIANRGEIAVRIIRACRELDIKTVAVYSEADKKNRHVLLADEAYCIGKAPSSESYLKHFEIIKVAKKTGAEAIHPGYGFLSENAEFAQACIDAGITFIGPSIDALNRMGDKSEARATMMNAKVPVPLGTKKPVESIDEAKKEAKRIGFPILIKPSAGGGGKGMQIVNSMDELPNAVTSSQAIAKSAFGCGDIYMERFIHNARHIEVQILADNYGNTIHLGERDCSVQRRHQKLVEEAPSPVIDEKLRAQIGKAAIKAAKAVDYSGAGTVEFLMDGNKEFFFIEMNTRIQVEHPVTEMITGIDLVKSQILVAAGEELGIKQKDVTFNGHAIECRINAEDPDKDFMPCPGKIHGLGLPGGPGVRVDTHIYSGYTVPHHYDSLLAKFIIHGPDRATAIKRMKRALKEFHVDNLKTTVPFHLRIMDDLRFNGGEYSTDLVEKIREDEEHEELKGFMRRMFDAFMANADH